MRNASDKFTVRPVGRIASDTLYHLLSYRQTRITTTSTANLHVRVGHDERPEGVSLTPAQSVAAESLVSGTL